MALSQDEQRMLAEIERRLASDDPSLASCLTTFRRPGPATVLRSPRARIIGSLFTVLLVAMVSLMVYAMVPFRPHTPPKHPLATTTASTATHASISAATGNGPNRAPRSSSSVSAKAPTSQSAATRTAAATAAGETQPTKVKSAGQLLPEVSP